MRDNNEMDALKVIQPLYEDNHILVVVKPPNMLTQGDDTGDPDLLSFVREYIRISRSKPGEAYVGLVHRLDRPVGGLVVFALTSKAASRLSDQVRMHSMAREYLAVCENGSTLPEHGTVSGFLYEQDGFVKSTDHEKTGSKRATLTYQVISRNNVDDSALVHICLETGRKHQIRVQMASIGHPLKYDMRYGNGVRGKSIGLWGAVQRIQHPTLKKPMCFTSLPDTEVFGPYRNDIKRFLETMIETESVGSD